MLTGCAVFFPPCCQRRVTSLVSYEQELAQLREAQEQRSVRARIWRYIFSCYAEKKGGSDTAPNDPKGDQGERVKDIVR